MDSKKGTEPEMDSGKVSFVFSKEEEAECYAALRSKLIKFLYLIEEEGAYKDAPKTDNKSDVNLKEWIYGLMFDFSSSNRLCHNKLTKVIIKVNGLCDGNHYREMTHDQIKRQIFEAKGMLDYLVKQAGGR